MRKTLDSRLRGNDMLAFWSSIVISAKAEIQCLWRICECGESAITDRSHPAPSRLCNGLVSRDAEDAGFPRLRRAGMTCLGFASRLSSPGRWRASVARCSKIAAGRGGSWNDLACVRGTSYVPVLASENTVARPAPTGERRTLLRKRARRPRPCGWNEWLERFSE